MQMTGKKFVAKQSYIVPMRWQSLRSANVHSMALRPPSRKDGIHALQPRSCFGGPLRCRDMVVDPRHSERPALSARIFVVRPRCELPIAWRRLPPSPAAQRCAFTTEEPSSNATGETPAPASAENTPIATPVPVRHTVLEERLAQTMDRAGYQVERVGPNEMQKATDHVSIVDARSSGESAGKGAPTGKTASHSIRKSRRLLHVPLGERQ